MNVAAMASTVGDRLRLVYGRDDRTTPPLSARAVLGEDPRIVIVRGDHHLPLRSDGETSIIWELAAYYSSTRPRPEFDDACYLEAPDIVTRPYVLRPTRAPRVPRTGEPALMRKPNWYQPPSRATL